VKIVGAMAQLGEINLLADAAGVEFQSIPQTYRHLVLEVFGRGTVSALETNLMMRFNNDSTSIYDFSATLVDISGDTYAQGGAQIWTKIGVLPAATAPASYGGSARIEIPDYTNTTFHKQGLSIAGWATSTTNLCHWAGWSRWRSTAAVTMVGVYAGSGSLLTGTRVNLYGIKAGQ
jgi:hypothetical protein